MAKTTDAKGPLKLFWCWTEDHEEDWFVVARSPGAARRFHEDAEGYDRGNARAKTVATLPEHMQDRKYCGWPSEQVIVACGGELKHDVTPQVVVINGETYCEGDISHLYMKGN